MEDEEWEALESPWQIESVPSDDHSHSLSHRESVSEPSENLEESASSPTPPPEYSSPASLRLRIWEARRAASEAIGAWRFWTIAAGAAMAYFYYRRLRSRWRRRSPAIREDTRDRLAIVLREKDEKIDKLLVRIAEMNEALLARRRVPVIRVS